MHIFRIHYKTPPTTFPIKNFTWGKEKKFAQRGHAMKVPHFVGGFLAGFTHIPAAVFASGIFFFFFYSSCLVCISKPIRKEDLTK